MQNELINNYRKAFVEVEAVLSCLELDAYNKIPFDVIDNIEKNKDKNYIFEYDEKLEYEAWNLMKETKAVLYNIFKNYIATNEEKEYFKQKEKVEIYKIEKEKVQNYKYKDLFERKQIEDENLETEKNSLIECKENLFIKILKRIKSLFKIQ